MHLTWYGESCFKIQTKDFILVLDPFSKEVGLKPLRTKANVLLLSSLGKEANLAPENIREAPLVIKDPGEYEAKGIFIEGYEAAGPSSPNLGVKTIFNLKVEEIQLCHLGFLDTELEENQIERIGNVDVLLLPIGGKDTLSVKQAIKVMNTLEPRLVVPMNFRLPCLKAKKEKLEDFLAELGLKKEKLEEKIILKKKELPTEGTKMIFLKPPL